MSKINITLAKEADAHKLKAIAVDSFKGNFEKYGHYPPGIESLKWHQDKINNGIYYKIQYNGNLVGGIYITSHPNNEMKIEFLFLSPDYQGKKIGATVMGLVEDKYKEVKKWFLLTPYKDIRNHHYAYQSSGIQAIRNVRRQGIRPLVLDHGTFRRVRIAGYNPCPSPLDREQCDSQAIQHGL